MQIVTTKMDFPLKDHWAVILFNNGSSSGSNFYQYFNTQKEMQEWVDKNISDFSYEIIYVVIPKAKTRTIYSIT